jgi:hypothetical protein
MIDSSVSAILTYCSINVQTIRFLSEILAYLFFLVNMYNNTPFCPCSSWTSYECTHYGELMSQVVSINPNKLGCVCLLGSACLLNNCYTMFLCFYNKNISSLKVLHIYNFLVHLILH